MKTKKLNENQRFTKMVDALLRVPHSELKSKMDEEKNAKRKAKKASASREGA